MKTLYHHQKAREVQKSSETLGRFRVTFAILTLSETLLESKSSTALYSSSKTLKEVLISMLVRRTFVSGRLCFYFDVDFFFRVSNLTNTSQFSSISST